MSEDISWLPVALCPGIGPANFSSLLEHFPDGQAVWQATEFELQAVLGIALTEKFIAFKKTFSLEKFITEIEKKKIIPLVITQREYPTLLKQIPHPPAILFVKGDISVLSSTQTIGIVGTRSVSVYGQQVTTLLTRELVAAGFTIVSGLAMGVDATAHTETLVNGGKTIAVLGSGVDVCTPAENARLYEEILDSGGMIVSTLKPGTRANAGTFPARNRIIAGLSRAIVVTEAGEESGALITAADARRVGRPVFAVPGPITSGLSRGVHFLLQSGATLVTSGKDVAQELGITPSSRAQAEGNQELKTKKEMTRENLTREEKEVCRLLENEGLQFDAIVRTIGKPAAVIGSLLSLMELKGIIEVQEGIYHIV